MDLEEELLSTGSPTITIEEVIEDSPETLQSYRNWVMYEETEELKESSIYRYYIPCEDDHYKIRSAIIKACMEASKYIDMRSPGQILIEELLQKLEPTTSLTTVVSETLFTR